ncbi:MAG TPA: thiamine pyrophosphate-binding protein [Candidatus Eisenbacteria bacterium]|nr:thiamine pyrophosphate-binding protein [Candidatus Eisenbacteria bacterium]
MDPQLAKRTVEQLSRVGIDFITYLPETRLSDILPVLDNHEAIQLVPVASEAEAVTIASGAALVGKRAACYMEGTGLFVCSYNLLTVAIRVGVPLLLLVSYVGSFADQRNSFRFAPTGIRTEAQLKALGIEYQVIDRAGDIEEKIRDATRMMHALKQPVALLFTGDYST